MRSAVGTPFVCPECHGPSRIYRGSVHGWLCGTCLDQHLSTQAAKADAADAKLRRNTLTKLGFGGHAR